jgi:hypothetical protein
VRKIKSGKSRAGPAPKPEGKASHQKEKGYGGHYQREEDKTRKKMRRRDA